MTSKAVSSSRFGVLATAAIAATWLMAGCSSPGTAIDPQAQARAAAAAPAPPEASEFPPIDSASWKQGAFPSIEALRQMNTGMGKDQVRNLLSWPHFREGIAGVHEWNYIFHFRTGNGPEYITCQYMVRFNDEMLTTGAYWKNPECQAFASRSAVSRPTVTPIAAPPAPVSAPQKITLGADGMFRFDGSGPDDLLPKGRRKVELLASEIRRSFRSLESVTVTGHTDRLGSDAYNDALSLARANTIRDLLVRQGVDARTIRTAGAGKRQPVVECAGTKSPRVVACLQPNRRVEIEVAGVQ